MHIDIVSDTICPWCYIGKRRFERALQSQEGIEARINWRAFQLNPEMPKEGIDRETYLITKFGSEERVNEVFNSIERAGATEGITFDFDNMSRVPNTLDSHRLIAFAGPKGVQNALVDALFQRYFELAEDIGDRAVLAAAGADAGLDRLETLQYLESSDGTRAVLNENAHIQELGVSGVPCFILNKTYAVSGAQEPEVFNQAFNISTSYIESGEDSSALD